MRRGLVYGCAIFEWAGRQSLADLQHAHDVHQEVGSYLTFYIQLRPYHEP